VTGAAWADLPLFPRVSVPVLHLPEPSYRSTVNHHPPRHWAWVLGDICALALGKGEHLSPHAASQPISNKVRPLVGVSPSIGHILVVDDDEVFCYAAARALCDGKFDVALASDHRLALEILEGPQPLDLLITDVVMPEGINGFALARMARMRRLDLRVLYVTAYDVPTDEAIGKVLRKPIDPDVLVAEARDALAGRPIRLVRLPSPSNVLRDGGKLIGFSEKLGICRQLG
jgi:CheY-like chemotaxis protein